MTAARDQIAACLVAGAAGDAIGGPYDSSNAADIASRLTSTDVPPAAIIGDDTQLTLWTMEGLMRAHVRWLGRGIASHPLMVGMAYARWGLTQGIQTSANPSGWLIEQPEIRHRVRAAPRVVAAVDRGFDEPDAADRGIGAGAIMRIAPVGLLSDRGSAARLADEIARLTHGGGRAVASCVAYATIVASLRDGAALREACEVAIEAGARVDGGDVLRPALDKAFGHAESRPRSPAAVHDLGTGTTSLGALLHAVYATACTTTVEEAVLTAVTQDGLSSTSGALAGQLAALVHGPGDWTVRWAEQLAVSRVIEQMVDDWSVIASSVSDDAMWSGYAGDGQTVPGDVRERFPGG